ncbi:MAG: polysaccharide biosynthesis/export family protein [Vicinamibacterales bacterium]
MKAPLSLALALLVSSTLGVQARQATTPQPPPAARQAAQPTPGTAKGVDAPPDYVIGPDDVLDVIVWREKELSTDVKVRPDGKVSLPLLNDVQAAGLTPEEFRLALTEAAAKFVEDPSVTVIVKQINSRMVFVMGEVVKPGTYPLTAPTTVLQMLALAGGPTTYAKLDEIGVVRTVGGKTTRHLFNYKDVTRGRKMEQNIVLRPGDTVIVP